MATSILNRWTRACGGALLLLSGALWSAEFRVDDIRVQGLQRASLGALLDTLPVRIGDQFNEDDTPQIISAIYKSGLFEDIAVERRGGVLYIRVVERPGIAEIEIDVASSEIEEGLSEVLKSEGIVVGGILDRALVKRLEEGLQQQFYAIGKYRAKIDVQVVELPDERIKLVIKVNEGRAAEIRTVMLSGNRVFSDDEILDVVESKPSAWYDLFGNDEYSRLKLSADIDAINKLYFDNGYIDFVVNTIDVSLDRRQESIYINISVTEGRRYVVDEVRVGGETPVPRVELSQLATMKKGDFFSRTEALRAARRMESRLGADGYAFATVNLVPEPRKASAKVDLNYVVNAGQKVYVRRINIRGNTGTSDEVYRRELRQMESAPYASEKIELSRRRLRRLPYVANADIQDVNLPSVPDYVDLDVSVTERLSGYYNFGAGISSAEGAVLSFQVNQDNFLGTGNRVGFTFNNSKSNTRYGINFFDPYFTPDGVSRRVAFNYRATDHEEVDIAAVETDELRVELGFGLPITENDILRLGVTMQTISLDVPSSTNGTVVADSDIREFIDREGNDFFNPLVLSAGISYDARDRSLFPTEGGRINTNLVLFTPGINDLSYVKTNYEHRQYFPMTEERDYVLLLRGWLSYVQAFGNTSEVPFYDKLYAGGTNSVRGYQNNSLGPRDVDDDTPIGGDLRLVGNAALFFPTEWLYDPARLRMGVFTDLGNVFDNSDIDLGELRGSYGLNAQWLTVIGGISFSFAKHFNDESQDRTETFQFDLGTRF